MKLSTWWLPQTSGTHIRESRWFKSMYTLQGKIWLTRHTLSTLSPHIVLDNTYLTWSTYSSLSWVTDKFGQISLSQEKGIPDYIPNTPAGRSLGPHLVSLPLTASEPVGLGQDSVNDKLPGLLDPYTSMRLIRLILAHGGQPIGP
jgi:hypothetical protein